MDWTNPKGVVEPRVVPQINMTDVSLRIDPERLKYNIGGSALAQVVDIILPMFSRLITVIMNTKVSQSI